MTSKGDKARYDKLSRMGCIACRKWLLVSRGEIHHTRGRTRRGANKLTIPLCPYHHRGEPAPGLTVKKTAVHLGPSLALDKKAFIEEFGTEQQLLDEVNALISVNSHTTSAL